MTYKMKTMLAAAALALTVGSLPSAQAASKKLTAPDPDWTGGVVTCRVLQYIMENEMGYKVKKITMPSGAGVAEGIRNGDLDWFPTPILRRIRQDFCGTYEAAAARSARRSTPR